jgi:dTMP kinase
MLSSAPKVVMETLRGVDDARAWELRRAVASDCKEALDSVHGMDTAEAWALRDEFLGRWTSTVVKSLGPLAETTRGRALVEHVLGEQSASLSLLKHLTAIALGNHAAEPDLA